MSDLEPLDPLDLRKNDRNGNATDSLKPPAKYLFRLPNCEAEVEVSVDPITPAKLRAELRTPSRRAAEISRPRIAECGHSFDAEKIQEAAFNQ